MENSVFSANHLPSQALVVLSEAASGLHEALRNQRPFQTRLSEAKNLHSMPLVGSYGTHLLHSFHPHLIPSMLSSGGASNFFAGSRSSLKSGVSGFQLPSAFSPPKYIGISLDQGMFGGHNESYRTDSGSPTVSSLSPLNKPDSAESKNLDYDSEKLESPRSSTDSLEYNRNHVKTNVLISHSNACPVCGAQLSSEDWNTHFLMELDRLYKLSSGNERNLLEQSFPLGVSHNCQDGSMRTTQNRWETFKRIRSNRQSRLRLKVRKRKYTSDFYFYDDPFCHSCPICQRKFPLDSKQIDDQANIKDEIETVDVESCDETPDSGSDASSNHRLEGVLYKSVCLINKDAVDDVIGGWDSNPEINAAEKLNNERCFSSQFYNLDVIKYESNQPKNTDVIMTNDESEEDVIVDDDTKINSSSMQLKKTIPILRTWLQAQHKWIRQ